MDKAEEWPDFDVKIDCEEITKKDSDQSSTWSVNRLDESVFIEPRWGKLTTLLCLY